MAKLPEFFHFQVLSGLTEIGIQDVSDRDFVEVVRCRDCKWTETDGMEDLAIYCEKLDKWEMPPDGFCWLGKKREES